MVLVEAIHTGYCGESYVRCYVWAHDVFQAQQLAYDAFFHSKRPVSKPSDLTFTILLYSHSEPMATIPSDSGWED
jgi:hypothetical protein